MAEEVTGKAELLDVLQDRYAGYAFFSRVYREEVSPDLLRQLVRDAEQSAAEEDTAGEGQVIFEAYIAQLAGADVQAAATELAAEYAGLFLNAGRQPVFPYESVYTSPERLVMQRARDEVLAEYRQEGLDKSDGLHEPEDHIAIELEFMAHLCQKAAKALEQGDRAGALACLKKQQAFLSQHLLVWVPSFCQDVERAAQSGFYRGTAQLMAEMLGEEQETVDELIAALQG